MSIYSFSLFPSIFLEKLIQTVLLNCVSPWVNFKNNSVTSVNLYNFSYLSGKRTAGSDFHWLSDLGGEEKQTYHAVGLGERQNFLKILFSQIYFYVKSMKQLRFQLGKFCTHWLEIWQFNS